MKWSWRLGRVLGIDVFVHATFVILLAWVGLSHYLREGTVAGAIAGMLFISAVFGAVVLHELGHALTARRFGIQTKNITLLPIGGVARLERMPEDPRQELLVALAGPAVNVVLAVALFVVLTMMGEPWLPSAESLQGGGPMLTNLLWVNVLLAVFNMVPAFPMDGGRALRALLAMGGDYVRATKIAAGIGQALALLLGLVGLFGNPILVFIALFVWIGAASEAGAVQTKAALEGLPVQAAMLTDLRVLRADEPLSVASEALLAGSQVDFPVVNEDGALTGVLTRTHLIEGLTTRGPSSLISGAMSSEFETAAPGEKLVDVLTRMQAGKCSCLPVVEDGSVIGLVTTENVTELVMIRGAMRARSLG